MKKGTTTVLDEVMGHLERSPKARERKHKNEFIGFLLFRKYSPQMQTGVTQSVFEHIAKDVGTYDRAWRYLLQHNEYLRGSDYYEKDVLEQETELNLGYEPGFVHTKKKMESL